MRCASLFKNDPAILGAALNRLHCQMSLSEHTQETPLVTYLRPSRHIDVGSSLVYPILTALTIMVQELLYSRGDFVQTVYICITEEAI